MKTALKQYLLFLGLLPIAALVGCGPPDYYKCSGTVVHKGNPIPFVQITFEPEIADSVRPPFAMSDKDGKFEMKCGREIGVPPGKYKITIEDPAKADGGKTSTEPDYLYVTDRYGPLKSDLMYESSEHKTNWELDLPESEYTGPPVRDTGGFRNTTDI